MDRQIVYPGAIPLDSDILSIQRNMMVALGYVVQAAIGNTTYADGLTPFQTTVPSMAINIGPGSIVAMQTIDATAFGSLSSDNVNPLMKIAINKATILSSTFGTMTAPVTTGQSINYLIQASYTETDTTPVVLPYYNSSNPAVPYSGPGNSGTPQNTQRLQVITFGIKAGSPAATGSQVTPNPDAGFVGLFVVTVAYAQTTILNANIAYFPTAPFLGTKIGTMRRKLTADTTYYVNGTTGSDGNIGTAPSSAWQTLQGAWGNILKNIDCGGYVLTVKVADGNYAPINAIGSPIGAVAAVQFVGNVTTPSNCVVTAVNSSCFAANQSASLGLSGFKVTASGTGSGQGIGFYAASAGAFIGIVGNVEVGSCATSDFAAAGGGQVSITSPYITTGTSGAAWLCVNGGSVSMGSFAVTLSSTPVFTSAFAVASGGSSVITCSTGTTFVGSATGQKYAANFGGFVNTLSSANVNFLPGSVAGVSTTGYYN